MQNVISGKHNQKHSFDSPETEFFSLMAALEGSCQFNFLTQAEHDIDKSIPVRQLEGATIYIFLTENWIFFSTELKFFHRKLNFLEKGIFFQNDFLTGNLQSATI